MKGTARVSIFVLLGVLLLGGGAFAQAPPPGPSQVQGQRDLRFGTVIAGFPTVISRDSNEAARWRIRGAKGAEIRLEFVNLPASLQNGAFFLPISFSATDASWRSPGGGSGVFDPTTGTTAVLGNSGQMFVYLGGTATPPSNQQPGDYIADIDLEVYYTGN
jgi:hypothetical protein